jgi:phosphohistidine phosphatase
MLGLVRIYLVRHGDAVSEDEAGTDRDRWLSHRGREAARVLARLLRDQGVAPDAMLSSPLPRAVQTAELIAAGIDYFGPISSRRCFEPGSQPRIAADQLLSAGASVIVVSHEPAVSSLGAYLLGRPAFPQFRTAQCCAIEDGKPTFSARADIAQIQAYFVD